MNILEILRKLFCSCISADSTQPVASDDDEIYVKTTIMCCVHTDTITVRDSSNPRKESIEEEETNNTI